MPLGFLGLQFQEGPAVDTCELLCAFAHPRWTTVRPDCCDAFYLLLYLLLMDAPVWQIKHSKWLFAQRGAGVDILSHEFFDVFKSLNVTCTWKWVCCVYSPGVAWWLCGWRLTCDGRCWVSTWKLLFRRHWAGDTPHREKCFQVTCMGWIVEIIKGNQGRFSHWGFVFSPKGWFRVNKRWKIIIQLFDDPKYKKKHYVLRLQILFSNPNMPL